MRQVYKTDEIPHLWAHKTQPAARNAQRNLYFDGDTIYSYGSHFPIARHIDGAILMTTRGYSSTTAQHICAVRRAIPGDTRVLFTNDPSAPAFKAREYWDKECGRLTLATRNAKSKPSKAKAMRELVKAECQREMVYAYLKAPYQVIMADRWEEFDAIRGEHDDAVEDRRQTAATRREERRYADLPPLADRINAWRNGGPVYRDFPETMLRVEGSEVVTSQGARFPLDHARRALPVVLRLLDKSWHRNGETIRLGHYQIDSIQDGVVLAGCHRVTADEVRRLAADL